MDCAQAIIYYNKKKAKEPKIFGYLVVARPSPRQAGPAWVNINGSQFVRVDVLSVDPPP